MPASTKMPRWPAAVMAVALVALLLHGAHGAFGLGRPGLDTVFNAWVYDGLMLTASLLCLARAALRREDRTAWLAFGLGLLSYFGGEMYYSLRLSGLEEPPFPSPADALYLGFYPGAYVGLVLLGRACMRNFRSWLWLDGVIAALAVAALGAMFVLPPVLHATGGDLKAVATTLAYPLGDLLLLALVLGFLALTGVRSGPFFLIAAGLAVGAVADSLYLVESANGTYVEGRLLDTLWPAGTLLIAAAAWLRPGRRHVDVEGWRLQVVPSICFAVVLAVQVYGELGDVGLAGRLLGYAALFAIFVRAVLTFRENVHLLAATRREARTDALTGLGNRRALMADLVRELEGLRPREERRLLMLDLDGFKQYNDAFGHPAGDALLERLGHRLGQAVRPQATAYRMGGDEFCVLVHDPAQSHGVVEIAAHALSERGEGFQVTSSYGVVEIPRDASDPAGALQLADQRMYAQKDGRRASARRQARDVLLRLIAERAPSLGEHIGDVTARAVELGRELGLEGEQLDVLARASELHDVGKVAVPDAILNKPGPLDPDEQAFMRRHPAIADRILSEAPALRPVARIVRSSHEHWDGGGYPDGLAGEGIPLESRIVAVCDAYDAMTDERSWRDPMTAKEAADRLNRESGTRFDPTVVRAFHRLLEAEAEAQEPAAVPQ